MTTAPTRPPEFVLEIDRADTRPIAFEFVSSLNATELLDLTGSHFEMRLFDATGARVLVLDADPVEGRVSFEITLGQRAQLKAGTSGRFEIIRLIAPGQEVWGRGTTNVKGMAHG